MTTPTKNPRKTLHLSQKLPQTNQNTSLNSNTYGKSIRETLLVELQALEQHLRKKNRLTLPGLGIPFFCQLDQAHHPATVAAYQCDQCARYVCQTCYEAIQSVQLRECPFCQIGTLLPALSVFNK